MLSWSDGYVADSEYTSQFFPELSPANLAYAGLIQGLAPADHNEGRYRYCELGCGNGVTTVALAAANPDAEFVGIDFMPSHIVNARRLAKDAGLTNVTFHEVSFQEALGLDFAPFDYITSHGVYSWITPENRQAMVSFMKRFLAPGGYVYLSYNCLPGWSASAPLQKLLSTFATLQSGNSIDKVRSAMARAKLVRESKAAAFEANPVLVRMLEGIGDKPVNYLAQEYLNGAWHPLYVTDVANELEEAKLTYASSATHGENDLRLLLSDEQRKIVEEMPTTELRELVKDFMINQQFRRDVYIRGARRMSGGEQVERFQQTALCLRVPADQVKYELTVRNRKGQFDNANARAVVAGLADGAKTIAELRMRPDLAQLGVPVLRSVVDALLISNQAFLTGRSKGPRPLGFNRAVTARALTDRPLSVVATGLGVAIPLGNIDQVVLEVVQSAKDDAGIIAGVAERLHAAGRNIIKDNKTLTDPAEVNTHLGELVTRFKTNLLPWLKGCGLA